MEAAPSYYGYGLPFSASARGAEIDQLLVIVHVFMLALFIGWGSYFVYCLVRFRARPNSSTLPRPRNFKLPTLIEVGVALVEIILLVFISTPIWNRVTSRFPDEKKALVIRVTAEQYAWNVHYPGRDGRFGKLRPELVDGTNPIGIDRTDPDAKDDLVTVNALHVPVNQPVIIYLSSKDVVHSFFLPVLRVKQDVIPGMTIPIWFQADKTGQFEIACAQLCGLGHYRMKGLLSIDTVEQFEAWRKEEEKSLAEAG